MPESDSNVVEPTPNTRTETRTTVVQRTVSVIVGYKYYFGAHMALTHGPVDFVSRIKVGDKCAWSGVSYGQPDSSIINNVNSSGVRINISASNLFGGVDGEGGVSGKVDFLQGYDTQAVNDYLAKRLGGTDGTPAFRGVTSMVLRQVYVSANNPYLKPWAFTMTRVKTTTYGEDVWYAERACIGDSCPALFPIIDEDGVELYAEPPAITPIGETLSGTSFGDGKWKYRSRAEGNNVTITIPAGQELEAEVLLVGPGSNASSQGNGGAGGEIVIAKVKLTEGIYTLNSPAGPIGEATSSQGSPARFYGPGIDLQARGGAAANFYYADGCSSAFPVASAPPVIISGYGAPGSIAGGVGCTQGALGVSGLAGPGGGGGASAGSESISNGIITNPFCAQWSGTLNITVRGGSGGGSGACGAGRAGTPSTVTNMGDNRFAVSTGKGGDAGEGKLLSFLGTPYYYAPGGKGSGPGPQVAGAGLCCMLGFTSSCTTEQVNSVVQGIDGNSLRDAYSSQGVVYGAGGESPIGDGQINSKQRALGGFVAIRWRVA